MVNLAVIIKNNLAVIIKNKGLKKETVYGTIIVEY